MTTAKTKKTDYVTRVETFIELYTEIHTSIEAEYWEMRHIQNGNRKTNSKAPLGKKFLMNRGHELQELITWLEQVGLK